MAEMLHISPQRRPPASHIVRHPWVVSQTTAFYQARAFPQQTAYEAVPNPQGARLKETVAATYRAIATSPQVAHLGPVAMSELARRRFRDKATQRVHQQAS